MTRPFPFVTTHCGKGLGYYHAVCRAAVVSRRFRHFLASVAGEVAADGLAG